MTLSDQHDIGGKLFQCCVLVAKTLHLQATSLEWQEMYTLAVEDICNKPDSYDDREYPSSGTSVAPSTGGRSNYSVTVLLSQSN